MFRMKNIFYGCLLALSGLTVLFSGCTKEDLDLTPLSAIGDNGFYQNADEVRGAVIAMYDGLQQIPLREFALTEMRSDNTRTKSSEGDWKQFQDLDVKPTNLAVGTYWSANYNVVFRANRVLENLDNVEDADLRIKFEGEARFVRALAYFNLVRAFGEVPLVDRVIIQTDEEFFDRDSEEAVYSLIISDFEQARSLLPTRSNTPFGRATAGAAGGMLGKVLLTRGDYAKAETVLSEVISSGEYTLQDDYADVFYNEGNSEILFAIPYLDDDANEGQDFSFEFTAGGAVSGLNYLTDDLINALDPEDEERNAVLRNPDNPAEVGKFLTQSADARLAGNDWIVLRYADVLLMLSEAILEGGNSTSNLTAINAYNQVRARAGLETLPTDGSGTLTKEALLYERRIELAFENQRLYDLIRFGVADSVLGAFAAAEGFSYEPTDLLLPIPQAEINVSNNLLTQNPGY